MEQSAKWAGGSTLASALMLAVCTGMTIAIFLVVKSTPAFLTGITIGSETFQINNLEAKRSQTFAYAAAGVSGLVMVLASVLLYRSSRKDATSSRYLALTCWLVLLAAVALSCVSFFYLYDSTIFSDASLGVFHNLSSPTANVMMNVNWCLLLLTLLGASALGGVTNIYHFFSSR